jgi:hypothetical protein
MLQSYSDRLRMVRYSLTEHEKVTFITFPVRDGIFCLSATPTANMNKIRDKVMKVLKLGQVALSIGQDKKGRKNWHSRIN